MIFNLILFLSLYLPFQIALNPTEGIDLASVRVFIIALFLLWLAQGLKDRRIIIKEGFISGGILIFLFLTAFSLLVAENIDWSLRKLMYLFSVFPLYFVASDIIDSQEKAEKVLRYLLYGGAATAILGIGQFFLQFIIGRDDVYALWANFVSVPFLGHNVAQSVQAYPSWLVNVSGITILRATAVFPDPHMFSFFLGLLLPLSLGFFIYTKRLLWLVVFFLIFLADIFTFSRGGYLGLFTGFLSFWFSGIIKLDKRSKFFLSVIAIVILAGLFFVPNPVSKRFSSSFDLKEGSNKGRLEMWGKAGEAISSSPLMGVGLGNYPLFVKPTAGYREPIYAHNTYLDIAAETGIFNCVVWISLLGVIMIRFWQKAKENVLFLACFMSLAIFSVHSAVETAIYSPVVLAVLLIIISLGNIDDKHTQMA